MVDGALNWLLGLVGRRIVLVGHKGYHTGVIRGPWRRCVAPAHYPEKMGHLEWFASKHGLLTYHRQERNLS